MSETNPQNTSNVPNGSEAFGTVRHASETFGKLPKASEDFGSLPHRSETLGSFPKGSERKENHTLTVREAARMFEEAGVARTERSITNWCQPNRSGIARLDAYFDPNERRYFITPQSVDLAIQEEKARMAKLSEGSERLGSVPNGSEDFGKVLHRSEREQPTEPGQDDGGDAKTIKRLEDEILDLKITNKGKDFFIEQLKRERDGFAEERKGYIDQIVASNRKVGELETRLLQLEAPKEG